MRSGQTISAHFHEVMRSLLKLHPIFLVKPSPVVENCTNDNWKWFKGCLSALDGTHIGVHVPSRDKSKYRTRKGSIAVNVLGGQKTKQRVHMESGETCGSVIGRIKKPEKIRRIWSAREEEVLIHALKDVITKGWKSENGFKAGYLTLQKNAMQASIPGTDLRGNPHINSKIHMWKKTYSSLVTILTKSGVGWNDIDKTIEATDDTWEAIVKADPSLRRCLRHKNWKHHEEWCEIYGNDRATGDQSKTFENALHDVLNLEDEVPNDVFIGDTCASKPLQGVDDSISETHTPSSKPIVGENSKTKKRKKSSDVDGSIVASINNLADITKVTMADLVKQLATENKISDAQDMVLDALQGITDFSKDEQVQAAQLLFNNHNNLALFQRLGDE